MGSPNFAACCNLSPKIRRDPGGKKKYGPEASETTGLGKGTKEKNGSLQQEITF